MDGGQWPLAFGYCDRASLLRELHTIDPARFELKVMAPGLSPTVLLFAVCGVPVTGNADAWAALRERVRGTEPNFL